MTLILVKTKDLNEEIQPNAPESRVVRPNGVGEGAELTDVDRGFLTS